MEKPLIAFDQLPASNSDTRLDSNWLGDNLNFAAQTATMKDHLSAASCSLDNIHSEINEAIYEIGQEIARIVSDPNNYSTEPHVLALHPLPTGHNQRHGTFHSLPFDKKNVDHGTRLQLKEATSLT